MRYSYVTPAPTPEPAERTVPALGLVVLKPSAVVPVGDPVVPAQCRRWVAILEGRQDGRYAKIYHAVAANLKVAGIVHSVSIRTYGRSGEPLGWFCYVSGHAAGGQIWHYQVGEARWPWQRVNSTQYDAWIRGLPPPAPLVADRGRCPRCTIEDVRIKKDGAPYKHRDPITDLECLEG